MGYHIFTTRKVILTHQMNDTETTMMNKWIEQTALQNQVSALYARFSKEELTDQQRMQFSASLQDLSNSEDQLEREIQLLETKYSEKSQELTKVEEQEKTSIENDTPIYSGAGGNK
ncbi:hypothetical protein IKQ26_04270 [bacterium]|nr:hypothetical protein [bacterium]